MYSFCGPQKISLFQYGPAKGQSLRVNQGENSSDRAQTGSGKQLQLEASMDLTRTGHNCSMKKKDRKHDVVLRR